MPDINFGEELQKPVTIAGHKVPLGVIGLGLGALVAAYAVLTRGSGGSSVGSAAQPASPADGGATPITPAPVPTPSPIPDTSGIADTAAQLQGQISGFQAQIDALTRSFADAAAARSNDIQSTLAPAQMNFAADNASQNATLRAESPVRAEEVKRVPVIYTQTVRGAGVAKISAPAVVERKLNAIEGRIGSPSFNQSLSAGQRDVLQTLTTQWLSGSGGASVGVEAGDSSRSYTIASGDTLGAIARRNNTTVGALLALNPQIKNPNVIRAGATLKLG